MTRVLLILALVLTAFWVFTIVDCAVQPSYRHRGVPKPVWILIVVLLPVLGGIMWLAVGRTRARALNAPTAPDDDPEFLGRIGTMSDQDERIRRLEEELAQLDAEAEEPQRHVEEDRVAEERTVEGKAKESSATPTGTAAPTDPPARGASPEGDDDGRGQRGVVG